MTDCRANCSLAMYRSATSLSICRIRRSASSARFVALADVYDALTSKRIYKDKFPHDMAKEMIAAEKGKHFDPEIVEIFFDSLDLLRSIQKRYTDED